jgi:hypothetical protein
MTGANKLDEANESGTPGIVRVDRLVRPPRAWAHPSGSVANRSAEKLWGRDELKRHGWVPLYGHGESEIDFLDASIRALRAERDECLEQIAYLRTELGDATAEIDRLRRFVPNVEWSCRPGTPGLSACTQG